MYDLLIIGGGPAGLSAAMTASNRNLSVCVVCGGAADSALFTTKVAWGRISLFIWCSVSRSWGIPTPSKSKTRA